MAIIKCHECKKEVSTKAKNCPSCGAPVKKRAGCMIVFLFIILCLALIPRGKETNQSPQSNQEKYKINNEVKKEPEGANIWEACSQAQKYVTYRLKAPRGAKFSSCYENQFSEIEDKWIVIGYVDAQNSFGTMLRNQYLVQMKYTKEPRQWELIKIAIE